MFMNTNIKTKQESLFYSLNIESPIIQFEFGNCDFKFQIKSASLLTDTGVNWQQLMTNFEIRVHILSYDKSINSKISSSEIILPLYLFNDSYKNEPFFELNKYFDKHIFRNNDDLTSIDKIVVNIVLIEKHAIKENYTLQLEIIKYS